MKNFIKYSLPIAIIIVGFLIAQALYTLDNNRISGTVSEQKAAEKAVNFIGNVALQGQAPVSLVESSQESGLYKIVIQIEDQTHEAYVSKDGKFLFAQGTDMDQAQQEQQSQNNNQVQESNIPKNNSPKVELFVMSFCPYGNQAEELMYPVVNSLGDKADIELRYVIYSDYRGGGPEYCLDEESKYCSMHGVDELKQNVRELCVQEYQPNKFWDFVKAINSSCSYQNVESCWENVAKNIGINTSQVKTCLTNEAMDLLAQEVSLNDKYGITGSPQLIINGVEFQGDRSSEAYKQGICSGFNSPPEECSETLTDNTDSVSGSCD